MALVPDASAGLRAIAHGATVVQLRDPSATTRRLEREAERLVAESPEPVVISSRVDLALSVGAAGVHLPEHDLPVAAARRLMRSGLVGRSVHSLAAALTAAAEGADYLVFGPVFPTRSHPDREAVGLERLTEVARRVTIPVLAIGGVDPNRAERCRQAGAGGFAAIGYFTGASR
jgi:thiamine-phosphate diphosphorylase